MHVENSQQKMYVMHVALIIFLMFGFGFLPELGPISHYGMQVLGVFIGCIYGWMIGQYVWPSVLGLIALGLCGDNSVSAVLSSAYGNQTLFLVLWSLIFCYAIERSGLLRIATNAILANRFASRGPWYLCVTFWTASAVGSCLATNSAPVILLMWSIFYGVMDCLGIARYDKYSQVVMVGITVCGYLGQIILPFNAGTQVVLGIMTSVDVSLSINYMYYILTCLLINIMTIPAMIVFFKYIVRIKAPFGKLDKNVIVIKKEKMTTAQKLVLSYAVILCLGMVLPPFLPSQWGLAQLLNNIGVNGMFALVNIAMMLTLSKGESLQDVTESLRKGVSWDIYFLVGTALAISPILVQADTGISVLLNRLLTPILADRSAFAFMALAIIIGTIITNFINNAVTMTLLIPLSYSFMQTSGGSFVGLCVIFAIVLLQGVVMPSGSGNAALMHGNSAYLQPMAIYKYAALDMVVLVLICIIIGIPVVNILF